MKKLMFIVAIALSLSLTGCQNKTDYKAQGEQLAKQLEELCQKNDTAAVIALNDSINAIENEIVSSASNEDVQAFREALTQARNMSAPIITISMMENGATKDEAVQPLIDNALNGGGDINAVTGSIDAAIKKEKADSATAK